MNGGNDRCVHSGSVCFEGRICIVWVGVVVWAPQRCVRICISIHERTRPFWISCTSLSSPSACYYLMILRWNHDFVPPSFVLQLKHTQTRMWLWIRIPLVSASYICFYVFIHLLPQHSNPVKMEFVPKWNYYLKIPKYPP